MDNLHRIQVRLDNTGNVPLPTFTQRADVGDGTTWVTIPAVDSPYANEARSSWARRLAARYGEGVPYPPDCFDRDPLPLLVREDGRMVLVAHGEAAGRAARRAAQA